MPTVRVRPLLVNGLLLLASTVVALLGVEALLRARPTLLGQEFANGVLSKYTERRRDGIFYRDRNLKMLFMIPNLKTSMYYNGYVWTHETDRYGFRNRTTPVPADIVLLGDSLIYGHGVDVEFTAGSFLAELTGMSVVNLARQGDCSFQQAYLLTEYIGLFRPRFVFYSFFENDLTDLDAFLSPEEMEAFIDQPLDGIRYPPREDLTVALSARQAAIRDRPLVARLRDSSYVFRAYKWAQRRPGPRAAAAEPEGKRPDLDDERSLEWRYTRKAIAHMHRLAGAHGAQLVMAPITPYNRRQREILRAIAAKEGLPLLDTSALAPNDATLWLPGDGHFSPPGARRFAEILAAYVRPGVRRGSTPKPSEARMRSPAPGM